MLRSVLAISVLLMVAPCSFAGAWGYGSFDNDDALDFLDDLGRKSSSQFLMSTLRNVDPKAKYVEAPECSRALAAAEIVAAARGHGAKNLPVSVVKWLERAKPGVSTELLSTARSAVETCRTSVKSELRELWLDSKEGSSWLSDTASLLSRLK